MGLKRNMYRLLVGKPERGLGGGDWIGMAEDMYRWSALVNVVLNLQVP
jgi:hypothetical protein